MIENLPVYISYVSAVAPDAPVLLKNERQAFYSDLRSRTKIMTEQHGICAHTKLIEGNEIEGLPQAINEIQPDLLVVGLRQEPGGFNEYLGGTVHRLASHAKCNVLGIR